MRRTTLALLRCPRCGGELEAEGAGATVSFGPVRCTCGAVYPMADGVLDLLDEPSPPSLAQRMLDSRGVARSFERGVRTALRNVSLRSRLDEASELLAVKSLTAPLPDGPILDLSCGTALHARSLAAEVGAGPVIGLDRSQAMLDEALHHLRESRLAVDLLHADAGRLPIRDASMHLVVNVGAFHLYPDAKPVLAEIARVLVPGGRLVCATLLPDALPVVRRVERRAGVFRRTEAELRAACEAAGLGAFERLLVTPAVLFRVVKPATSGV